MMSRFAKPFLMALLALAFAVWVAPAAQAGVTINPTMVLIEGRQRYADMTLLNTSDQPITYEMGWQFFRMTEGSGAYEKVDSSLTEFDLSKHLVFTPKRITVPPKSGQRVRFALRLNGAQPAPGDYRAHFELKEADEVESSVSTPGKTSIGVRVRVGYTAPVIYRVGESDVSGTIGNVSVRNNAATGKIEMEVPVTRKAGPYGLLGKISVYHKDAQGKETHIGGISNANVFPEITSRKFTVIINKNRLDSGTLRVVLSDSDDKKNIVFDQKTIPVR